MDAKARKARNTSLNGDLELPVESLEANDNAVAQMELQTLLQDPPAAGKLSSLSDTPRITILPHGHTPEAKVTHLETAVLTAEPHATIDSLLDKMGSPGRYQLLTALTLSTCMFPVIFCDLATIFYTIHPETSTCTLPLTNRTINEKYERVEYERGPLSDLTDDYVLSFDVWNNATETYLLEIIHGSHNNTCGKLDSLDVQSTEGRECWKNLQHQFEDNGTWSIVAEWNLVCSRYWLVSFATTVYFLGVMTGSMAFGHLADRFGRLRCILGCYVCFLPLGIATAYADTYWLFLALRFFLGFFVQGVQSVTFVLLMEFCSPKYRDAVGGLEGLFGGVAVGTLSGAAYMFPHWRQLQLCLIIPCFLALSEALFVRESLRWQMVHGKVSEARQTVVKVLKWNKLPPDPTLDEDLTYIREALLSEESKEAGYTWLDCFRTPKMRKYTISMSFVWFTVLFVYYGISFSTNSLNGSLHLNLVLGSLFEIPLYLAAVYFMRRFGRRNTCFAYFSTCAAFCIAAALMDSDFTGVDLDTPRTIIVFLARASLAGTYSVVFVYGSELFPTVLRNTAFGICICCHTFGGVLTPQVLLLGYLVHPSVPFVIFGLCCVTSCLVLLTLPETLNQKMPDTVQQVERK